MYCKKIGSINRKADLLFCLAISTRHQGSSNIPPSTTSKGHYVNVGAANRAQLQPTRRKEGRQARQVSPTTARLRLVRIKASGWRQGVIYVRLQ